MIDRTHFFLDTNSFTQMRASEQHQLDAVRQLGHKFFQQEFALAAINVPGQPEP